MVLLDRYNVLMSRVVLRRILNIVISEVIVANVECSESIGPPFAELVEFYLPRVLGIESECDVTDTKEDGGRKSEDVVDGQRVFKDANAVVANQCTFDGDDHDEQEHKEVVSV